jgi:hypothetical protein
MRMFYTVLCDKVGHPVKYLDPETLRVNRFGGKFGDPGEASQEFKACLGGEQSCYLEPAQFMAKARAIAQYCREMKRKRKA